MLSGLTDPLRDHSVPATITSRAGSDFEKVSTFFPQENASLYFMSLSLVPGRLITRAEVRMHKDAGTRASCFAVPAGEDGHRSRQST